MLLNDNYKKTFWKNVLNPIYDEAFKKKCITYDNAFYNLNVLYLLTALKRTFKYIKKVLLKLIFRVVSFIYFVKSKIICVFEKNLKFDNM